MKRTLKHQDDRATKAIRLIRASGSEVVHMAKRAVREVERELGAEERRSSDRHDLEGDDDRSAREEEVVDERQESASDAGDGAGSDGAESDGEGSDAAENDVGGSGGGGSSGSEGRSEDNAENVRSSGSTVEEAEGDDGCSEGNGKDGQGEQNRGDENQDENVQGNDSRADESFSDDTGRTEGGSHEEQRSTSSQDAKFPGKDYRAPRRVHFNRGKCAHTSSTRAEVMIKYQVLTATKCPCETSDCTKLVNIGTWGILGGGCTVFVHCGFKRKGGWDGDGYGFMGKEELIRHINTAKCRAKRGLPVEKKSLKEILGEHVYHRINDPSYTLRKKDRDGNMKKYYKCFICAKTVGFRSRHSHHVNAKHGTDLREQEAQQDSE